MTRLVTITYLEMTHRAALRPAREPSLPLHLARVERPSPEFCRFLYLAVGSRWWWHARLPWDRARWLAHLQRPSVQTWAGYVQGAPAGYAELERHDDESVELAYFGLLPAFIGQGLGGALLTEAVRRAWEWEPRRVWLHTCDLDHPAALANYRARGFEVFRVAQRIEELPDQMPEW